MLGAAGEFLDVNSLPPQGLLGLFNIKEAGSTPRPLNSIQFGFDVEDFLLRPQESWSNWTTVSAATGVTPVSSTGLDIVPQGRGRIVTGYACQVVTGAAELVRFKLGYSNAAANAWALFAGSEGASSLTDAAGAGLAWGGTSDKFLMSPGQRLVVAIERLTTAGSLTFNTSVRYLEFAW